MKSVATIGCVVALVIGVFLFFLVMIAPAPPDPAKVVEPTERISPDARVEGAGPRPKLNPVEPMVPQSPSTAFNVEVESCSGSRGYVSVEGHVRNTGTTTVHYVTLELRYENEGGEVVDTGTTYAVGSELLRPGESSRYRGMSRARGVRRCRAKIQDWRVAE